MKTKSAKVWQLQEAKAKFSELARVALSDGPQTISIRGKERLVLMAKEAGPKKVKHKETLLEFFMNSPLRGSGIVIERDKSPMRDVEL